MTDRASYRTQENRRAGDLAFLTYVRTSKNRPLLEFEIVSMKSDSTAPRWKIVALERAVARLSRS